MLTGNSVILRSFTESNITPIYIDWLRNPNLMKYSNQRFISHGAETLKNYLKSFIGTNNLFYAIYVGDDFVGTMTAYVSANHQTADMGLLVGNHCQGKGIGGDAWNVLMKHLFNEGVRKVSGGTLRCNVPMLKIMTRAEMVPDGVRVAHELIDGTPQDLLHFAKFGH